MIARMWKGYASGANVGAYLEHFEQAVLPELSRLDGFQGATVLRRDRDGDSELTVITLWESMDAIRRFAGDAVEVAVVAPAAQAVLRAYDTTVTHHEVLLKT
ncbi:MAG: antibiotic biosynthesis monooxygenase [Chloroflexi bacterium]|jgi:heme-degrading monooxygenase HmoA|nr:antibiotic biosynthesis monooxygenase [Chloroflexota bacterium]